MGLTMLLLSMRSMKVRCFRYATVAVVAAASSNVNRARHRRRRDQECGVSAFGVVHAQVRAVREPAGPGACREPGRNAAPQPDCQLDRLICIRIRCTAWLNRRIKWRSPKGRRNSEARGIRDGEMARLRMCLERGRQAAKVDGDSLARYPGLDKHRRLC